MICNHNGPTSLAHWGHRNVGPGGKWLWAAVWSGFRETCEIRRWFLDEFRDLKMIRGWFQRFQGWFQRFRGWSWDDSQVIAAGWMWKVVTFEVTMVRRLRVGEYRTLKTSWIYGWTSYPFDSYPLRQFGCSLNEFGSKDHSGFSSHPDHSGQLDQPLVACTPEPNWKASIGKRTFWANLCAPISSESTLR